jgi:hypothetical protein
LVLVIGCEVTIEYPCGGIVNMASWALVADITSLDTTTGSYTSPLSHDGLGLLVVICDLVSQLHSTEPTTVRFSQATAAVGFPFLQA